MSFNEKEEPESNHRKETQLETHGQQILSERVGKCGKIGYKWQEEGGLMMASDASKLILLCVKGCAQVKQRSVTSRFLLCSSPPHMCRSFRRNLKQWVSALLMKARKMNCGQPGFNTVSFPDLYLPQMLAEMWNAAGDIMDYTFMC